MAAFDVDGVMTDGRLIYLADGTEGKAFHVLDGHGIKLLRQAGIVVAWITARTSPVVERRAAELGVDHLHQGETNKLARLLALAEGHGIELSEVAYMGDDLPDLACLESAGLAIVPANAHSAVAASAHWRTRLCGGEGAVREACDLILTARGDLHRAMDAARRGGRP
jgi:3-deoxy-D-manno-octulosonate 8-phosphate phosphatase (KDO 8-P phosphatase)